MKSAKPLENKTIGGGIMAPKSIVSAKIAPERTPTEPSMRVRTAKNIMSSSCGDPPLGNSGKGNHVVFTWEIRFINEPDIVCKPT